MMKSIFEQMAERDYQGTITEIKVKARIVYGWRGAPGVAYTVTGKCADGRRRMLKRCTLTGEKGQHIVRLYAERTAKEALISRDQWTADVPADDFYAMQKAARIEADLDGGF